ncbi:MAG: glycosyltransferase family 2 protein [Candidatus Hatepunaea meridiana]|nr:glycosyltransferase family 2 protein [Candidatus Hatepunaea meridiana]
MTPRVTVIIVTYNSAGFIGECLDTLSKSAASGYLKVILVDNASTDSTADIIEKEYPWVNLVRSKYNNGFGAGNNIAISDVEGDYIFFLNPDTRVGPYCSKTLVDFLDDYDDAGCVGPCVIDEKGHKILSYFMFTGLFTSLWSAMELQRLFPLNRTNGKREFRWKPPNYSVEVDRLLGAAIMIRRKVLDQIGRFDERFFLYSEEEDICLRLRHAGWNIYYDPSSYVIHQGGTCKQQALPLMIAAANWSRYIYLRKHKNRISAEISRLVWIILLSLRLFISFLLPASRRKRYGYIWSLKSLLKPGYFDRVLRPGCSGIEN